MSPISVACLFGVIVAVITMRTTRLLLRLVPTTSSPHISSTMIIKLQLRVHQCTHQLVSGVSALWNSRFACHTSIRESHCGRACSEFCSSAFHPCKAPSVASGSSYPFNHASMGSFLESCRGVQLTLSLVDKRTVTGKMLMVERAKRAIEGCKESEEYVATVHLFEEQWGIIHKVRFEEIAQVSLVDTIMQEELSKSLTTALGNQMPKPPPPPKDSREAISVRARGDSESLCRASYVAAWPTEPKGHCDAPH